MDNNDPDNTPIWGIKAIAAVVGRTPRQAYHLLKRGLLDADQVGRQWVSTRRRLLAPFIGGK